jgi:hypothetical protein
MLTWLYVGYLAVSSSVGIAGIRAEIRSKLPLWVILEDLLGGVSLFTLIVAFASPTLTALLGRASVVLLVIAAAVQGRNLYSAWGAHVPPRGMTPRLNFWSKVAANVTMAAYLAPAYWMAVVVVRRVWLAGAP